MAYDTSGNWYPDGWEQPTTYTIPNGLLRTTDVTWPQLTQDDVRRIIREEFARLMSEWQREPGDESQYTITWSDMGPVT